MPARAVKDKVMRVPVTAVKVRRFRFFILLCSVYARCCCFVVVLILTSLALYGADIIASLGLTRRQPGSAFPTADAPFDSAAVSHPLLKLVSCLSFLSGSD